MKKTTTTNKPTTIVNFILDRSGSMANCVEGTISGFNKYIKDLQKKEGHVLFSLTFFDTNVDKKYTLVPLSEVKKLNSETYVPEGNTALYDAAVETIEQVAEQADGMKESKPAILTVIMTDGEENSSVKHDRECLNDLISKLKTEGNWSFIFLGANQDSWANASVLGVSRGNVANFQADNLGMQKGFNAVYCASANLMSMNAGGKGLSSTNLLDGLKSEGSNELT
jgi:uncharacterized protein YegL